MEYLIKMYWHHCHGFWGLVLDVTWLVVKDTMPRASIVQAFILSPKGYL